MKGKSEKNYRVLTKGRTNGQTTDESISDDPSGDILMSGCQSLLNSREKAEN